MNSHCVGEDLGSTNPSCDDTGRKTKPVRWPRADLRAMKAAQVALARKDLAWKREAGERHKAERAVAEAAEDEAGLAVAKAEAAGLVLFDPTDVVTAAVVKRSPRRSRNAEKQRATVTRLNRRAANRQHTRACQDVALLLVERPVLVATDPTRMVKPLLAKGGPAERRASAFAGLPPEGIPDGFRLTPLAKRSLRANMVATSFSKRIRRVSLLSGLLGAIHVMPGHEGSTATCPKCERFERKTLDKRMHDCPRCGLRMPRDQASAIVTLGRAFLMFRRSADPGGMIAKLFADRAEAREKRVKASILAARKAAGAGRVATKRAAERKAGTAGASPGTPGRSAPGQPLPKAPKRVRGQGRNVGRSG